MLDLNQLRREPDAVTAAPGINVHTPFTTRPRLTPICTVEFAVASSIVSTADVSVTDTDVAEANVN